MRILKNQIRGWIVAILIASPLIVKAADSTGAMYRADSARSGTFVTSPLTTTPVMKWRNNLGTTVYTAPVVASDQIVTVDGTQALALDRLTGSKNWGTAVNGRVNGMPAVVEATGMVYVADDEDLLCLNLSTGEVIWTFFMQDTLIGSPMVMNDVLYCTSRSGVVFALDAFSGAIFWTTDLGQAVAASPILSGPYLLIGTELGRIFRLNIADGTISWEVQKSATVIKTPSTDGTKLYVALGNDSVAAVLMSDGSDVWNYLVPTTGCSAPAFNDGKVYFATIGGTLHCLDADSGLPIWSQVVGSVPFGSPTIAGSCVYIGTNSGIVKAYDANSGMLLWNYSTGRAITTDVVIDSGQAYVVSDRRLYALAP